MYDHLMVIESMKDLDRLPPVPAVYFWYVDEEIMMVGMAEDLRARQSQSGNYQDRKHTIMSWLHFANGEVAVGWREIPDRGHRVRYEKSMIKQLRPVLNIDNRGENHYNAKLNDDSVREIRQRYKAGGVTLSALAKEHNVCITAVWGVVRGRSWSHID